MRNSSLVEDPAPKCTAKTYNEAVDTFIGMVGERSMCEEGTVRSAGAHRRQNAGMSSERQVRNFVHRKTKVSRKVRPVNKSKERPKGVSDGQQVDILLVYI